MHKKLKIDLSGNRVWFSSDFHINHNKDFIVQKRGFQTIQQHNDAIKHEVNNYVKSDDILFLLGDLSLNSTPNDVKTFLNQLNCQQIYTLWGNHESSTSQMYKEALLATGHKEDVEIYPLKIHHNLTVLGDYQEIIVEKQFIVLCHYSMDVFRESHKGAYGLFGHSHSSHKDILPENLDSRRLDVGIDVFKRPINFHEIRDIMNKKLVKIVDHHDSVTN